MAEARGEWDDAISGPSVVSGRSTGRSRFVSWVSTPDEKSLREHEVKRFRTILGQLEGQFERAASTAEAVVAKDGISDEDLRLIDKSDSLGRNYLSFGHEMLNLCELVLQENDLASFWRYFASARKSEVYAIREMLWIEHTLGEVLNSYHNFNDRIQELELEAEEVLPPKKKSKVLDALSRASGEQGFSQLANVITTIHNERIKQVFERRREDVILRQIAFFMTTSILSIGLLFVFLFSDLFLPQFAALWPDEGPAIVFTQTPILLDEAAGAFQQIAPLFVAIPIFGALGASVSGLLTLSKTLERAAIPERVGNLRLSLARVVVGTVGAMVVFVFLLSGAINILNLTYSGVLAVSFVSGFSERLLLRAVQSVGGDVEEDQGERFTRFVDVRGDSTGYALTRGETESTGTLGSDRFSTSSDGGSR
ncbi:hypothetical protein [Salinigranum sp.]|uniref:hypothetical protein n=1 Tax=Salinigranum sp. TaxID=1966351 RepID=UPI00356205DD